MRVRTSDLDAALRASYEAEAGAVAGKNKLLSRREQRSISSGDLAEAVDSLAEKGVPRPFELDAVVEEASSIARDHIAAVNQLSGSGRAFVSKKEIEALSDPALRDRATKLYEALKSGGAQSGAAEAFLQAIAPYAGPHETPSIVIEAIAATATGTRIDFGFSRDDGGVFRARATMKEGALSSLEILAQSPAVDPEVGAAIKEIIESGGGMPVNVLGYVYLPDGRALAAYERPFDEEHAPDRQLVAVDFTAGTSSVFVPADGDISVLRDLAVMMTRSQALRLGARYDELAQQNGAEIAGPMATFEAQLRIAKLGPQRLEPQTSEESAVGFDPSSEVVQLMAPSILGDNAVFTTFDRSGNFRLEDFN